MLKNKSGDLLGVFHRDDVGDIDLVWGDRNKNSGLDHIIEKHIERLKDFSSAEEAIQVIEDVINNGQIDEKKSKWDKVFIEKDGYAVVISKNVRNEKGEIVNENKNWVVTAFDATISPKRKEVNSSDVTRVTLNTNKGGRAVTSDERTSDSKDSELSQKSKEDAEENKKPRLEKADSKATEVSSTDALLRDALVRILRKMGIKVITDNKKAQRVLDRENGRVLSKGLMLANADTEKSDSTLSAIDNNANPTSWGTSDSIAKVDNRIEITKESINKINGLSKRINKEGRLSPEEFLLSIEKALGSNNDNVDKTQYFKGDNDRTLRLANHRCNCRMFLLHDHTTKNTSIVVKLSEKAFKGNKNVDAIEYVYFPDKLTKEVQLNILEGIKEWIDNGEYDKKCDQINISTIQNGIRKHVVRHGELEDAEIESLIAYIQEKIETIENETTDGIYNLLRKMAELNYNAYKGRGSSRFGFTTKIYKVKNVAVPKIANELLSRGEYVGFDREQRIIYFKDNNEHQISFHGFYEPNFSEELRDKVEYEAKWDGIKEFWRKEEDYRILRERQKQREKIQAEIDILTQHFYKENAVLTEQKYPWDLDYSSVIRDMAITGWSSQSYAKDAFNAFIAKSDEAKRLLEEQKKLKAQENAIPYSEIQNKLYSLEAKLKRLRKPESIEKTTKDIIELQKQEKETWKEILLLSDKIKGIGEEMVLLYHKLREQKRPEVERVNREMEVKREDYKNKIEILKNQELPKLNALRFFRTANGEAYGFTVDGKIYLDPTIAGAETAIHEYTHLWATALKNANPKEWSNIVSLLKGTPLWDKVASEYPELTTDDELADEVLAHYSGKRGAERLRKEAESIANGKGSLLDKAGAISALERVKEALTRFWKATADLLHIHFTTAEEVADKVLADLLNGVNPNEVARDKNLHFQFIGKQGAETLDKAEEASVRLDNLQVAKEMEAEKKDAKTVKLATGWERGADRKWRYEIMDGEFDRLGEMHPERRNLSQDEQKELDEAFFEIMNAFEKGALAYNEEIDESTDMADIYVAGGMERKKAERMAFLEEKERNLSKQPKHIDDYLSNKQLFDAYPELKEVVVLEGDGDFVFTGKLGSYNPVTNTLTLNDISQDVLIHEVQHIIQRIEGFAKGGNPNSPELKDNREYKKWKEQLDSMRSVSERETNLYKELQYFSDEAEKLDKIIEEMSNGLKTADEMSTIEEKKKELFEIEKSITVIINELEEERTKRGEKVSAMLGAEKSVLQRLYNNLSGEVEARNAQKRMKMTAEERRASLAEETEDVARKDQIFILDNLGESHMGTKVDKRMENIGEHYKGKKLSNEQKVVIDVFSGNKDNLPLSVTRADGKRTIIMRQGTENKAGTKHSLFRHYETNSGVITAEDIALIPQIVQEGNIRKVKGGKGFEYVWNKDGVRYKVYTEIKDRQEIFCDFYSNKKGNDTRPSISNRDAQNGNTQSSARAESTVANHDANIRNIEDNPIINEENLYRTSEKTGQSSTSAIVDSVMSLAERLHLGNVEIVTDASALSGKEARAKGFYTKSTGKITIVVPNNISAEDAVQTLLHEAVAHYGMGKIMVVLNVNKCLFIIVFLCALLYFINSNTFLFTFLSISKQKYLNFEKI